MHGDTVERLKAEPYVRGGGTGGAEKEAKLPGMNDAYQAAGMAENHEVSRLVLVMGKEGFRPGGTAYVFVQYAHLGLGEFGFTGDGQFFRFMVADLQPKLVTVYGRNLQRITDYIALHRQPWIRQADRDFVEGKEPIITRIEVTDWVKPEG